MAIPSGYQPIPGSAGPPMAGSTLVGPLDSNQVLSTTLVLHPRPGSAALPDVANWQSTPPAKRSFLNADEIAQRYGAASADLAAVTSFVPARESKCSAAIWAGAA